MEILNIVGAVVVLIMDVIYVNYVYNIYATLGRLRFIEYLKATYIKPEWMILSLLPVLPPDLRPVIANPRGYITGDINTHYQNVIYRNNNIEKLLDTFWIPRKFYSKISFSNHQKDTALMLSSIKSYFHSIYDLPIYAKKPLKLKNRYSISKLFFKISFVSFDLFIRK